MLDIVEQVTCDTYMPESDKNVDDDDDANSANVPVTCGRASVPFTISCRSEFSRLDGERRWYQFTLELHAACSVANVLFTLHPSFGKKAVERISTPPYAITREAYAESVVHIEVTFPHTALRAVLDYHVRLFARMPRDVLLGGASVGGWPSPRHVDEHRACGVVMESDYWWMPATPSLLAAGDCATSAPFEAALRQRVALLMDETTRLSAALGDCEVDANELRGSLKALDAVAGDFLS